MHCLIDSTNPDILIGTETWLSSSISSSEFFPSGYTVYRKDREDGYGGVLLAHKTSYKSHQLTSDSTCELLACQIELHNNPLIILAAYRPPRSDLTYLEKLCLEMERICHSNPSAVIWLAGDLNLPDINWETNSITRHQYPLRINEHFMDSLANCSLSQLVTFPTRKDNTLDIFATNRPSFVEKCEALSGISDHDIVRVVATMSLQYQASAQRKIYIWRQANFDDIRYDFNQFSSSFVANNSTDTDVECLWSSFKEKCNSVLATKIPFKLTSTKFHQPWINKSIKQLTRHKQRLYNKARRSGSSIHWNTYRKFKRYTQQQCKNAYESYVRSVVSTEPGNNPKRFWSFIKNKRLDHCGVGTLKSGDQVYSDNASKGRLLNDYFASVFTKDTSDTLPSLPNSPYPAISDISVTFNGVVNLLKNIKEHKAHGPDKIPNRLLKECATEIAPSLVLLFQASIKQSKVPSEWKHALVSPIFKNGDKSLPSNYRPVSLVCVCCKILEHIIYSEVMKHLNSHNILSNAQHGFRQNHSCESQLLLTVNDFAKALDDGKQIDAMVLDFTKAFDKVSHKHLFAKLSYYGIQGSILSWIQDFLTNRSQQVILDGCSSDSQPVTSGVPQGTVLGPLLFLCFVNDIPGIVSSTVRLYADDVLLYRVVNSTEDCNRLQHDLNALYKWAETWKMLFNTTKCYYVRFTNKHQIVQHTYHINDHILDERDVMKYLGILIDSKLSWSAHIDYTVKKANVTLSFLVRNFKHCSSDVKLKCYLSLVRPILEYASIIWSPCHITLINRIESVQRRSARFILNNYERYSSVTAMLEQLNLSPLVTRRTCNRIVMMFKIFKKAVHIPVEPPIFTFNRLGTRGHSLKLYQLSARINSYANSFFPDTIKLWNNLPPSFVNTNSIDNFKSLIYQHYNCN